MLAPVTAVNPSICVLIELALKACSKHIAAVSLDFLGDLPRIIIMYFLVKAAKLDPWYCFILLIFLLNAFPFLLIVLVIHFSKIQDF